MAARSAAVYATAGRIAIASTTEPASSKGLKESARKGRLLIYGATGHTGRLVAHKAKQVGLNATLAGRNEEKLRTIAEETGLPYDAFDLTNQEALSKAVSSHEAVLHIAGPFTETGPPVVESCIKHGAHYMDITGETHFLGYVQDKDAAAKAKGVMLLPAVGFDVVPGDCLAAHLKEKVPTATHLDLETFIMRNGTGVLASKGTMLSGAFHILPFGGLERRDGSFRKAAIGAKHRSFELGDGGKPVPGFSFPAAELISTAHSTNIPNITTYFPGSQAAAWPAYMLSLLGPALINSWPVKALITRSVRSLPEPSTEKAKESKMLGSAEVRDEKTGKSARASIQVNEGYGFTASSACEVARRVLEGKVKPGFQTPASAFGPNLVLNIPGEEAVLRDLP